MYPVVEFVTELRYRFAYLMLAFVLNFILFYTYSTELWFLVAKPLVILTGIDRFIYTGLADAFFVYLKLSFYFSFLFTAFLAWYHAVSFLSSGLFKSELIRSLILSFLIFFILLCGLAFFYFLFIPLIFWFFYVNSSSPFDVVRLSFEARVNDYLGLMLNFFFIYIFVVQVPVLLLFYVYCSFLNYSVYKRNRLRFMTFWEFYVLLFSPPDVFTQFVLFIYILIIFELLVFLENIISGYMSLNVR